MKVVRLTLCFIFAGLSTSALTAKDWGGWETEVVVTGVAQPVAMSFLPDGRAIVASRRDGTRHLTLMGLDTGERAVVDGLPAILATGDAGLLDVLPHPRYEENGWLYFAFSEGTRERSTLALVRGRLEGQELVGLERLLTADAYSEDRLHYGGRIAIAEGFLYLSVGDRHHRARAQDLSNHAGSILRLHDDGRVPQDNPFVETEDAKPEIWSYGHRNPQGLAFDPKTGELWSHEHGPRHGDELNRIEKGANYGWPVTSLGWEYDGGPVGMGIVRREDTKEPVWVWSHTIAPSGLLFYSGSLYEPWSGSILSGSMSRRHLNRLVLRDGSVVLEERRLQPDVGRVRMVAEGPDGTIYIGTDDGEIRRVVIP